ncbi:MAG TPA: UDP-N-acetylmuramoyl-tripeptide--D-alanyl-D-alanine ligase, partial [Acidimicrobiales bacterium]
MRMRASEIASATQGRLLGPDVVVDGVGIDSRELAAGALFVPIVDARDGHDFIASAVERGAAAVLMSVDQAAEVLDAVPDGVAVIEVDDTSEALADLGRDARRRLGAEPGSVGVVGITGSVGKTTTKDLLSAALAGTYPTTASLRSFNNELGVPLTLLNAPEGTRATVVEMGARGRGHIAVLCGVARPSIGVVTTVEMVHTQLFGELAEVAAAKAELVEHLPVDGVAVLNADNVYVAAMAHRTHAAVLRFATSPDQAGAADLWSGPIHLDDELRPRFRLHSPWGEIDVRLAVRGAHNVGNALAAAAAALSCGVPLAGVAEGLSRAEMSPWRMELTRAPGGARVLNDAYNAGPASMAAALRALAALGADR